jgi:alanine dehydrogenase
MNKTRLGIIAAAAMALPMLAPAIALADDGSAPAGQTYTDSTISLAGQQAIFNAGGGHLGEGAAEVLSGGVLGVEQAALDIPAELTGAPKEIGYVSPVVPDELPIMP